jgi:hypothetical protein
VSATISDTHLWPLGKVVHGKQEVSIPLLAL